MRIGHLAEQFESEYHDRYVLEADSMPGIEVVLDLGSHESFPQVR